MSESIDNLLIKILAPSSELELGDLPKNEKDWQYFFSKAREHALIPMAWQRFQPVLSEIPPEISKDLYREYLRYVASLEVAKEFYPEVLSVLSKNIDKVVILKGIFLAERYYQEEVERPFSDLDILIPKSELPKVSGLMESIGYKYREQWPRFFWERPQEIKSFLRQKEPQLMVEIHTDFLNKSRYRRALNLDMSEVWDNVIPTKVLGQKIFELEIHHLLLFLSFHLTITHRFNRLFWLYDLDRIITLEKNQLDWDKLAMMCRQIRAQTFMFLSLEMTRRIFKTSVPTDFLQEIKPGYPLLKIYNRLFNNLNLISLPRYSLTDLILFILRDDFRYRFTASLGLPYRISRLYLKGNAW